MKAMIRRISSYPPIRRAAKRTAMEAQRATEVLFILILGIGGTYGLILFNEMSMAFTMAITTIPSLIVVFRTNYVKKFNQEEANNLKFTAFAAGMSFAIGMLCIDYVFLTEDSGTGFILTPLFGLLIGPVLILGGILTYIYLLQKVYE